MTDYQIAYNEYLTIIEACSHVKAFRNHPDSYKGNYPLPAEIDDADMTLCLQKHNLLLRNLIELESEMVKPENDPQRIEALNSSVNSEVRELAREIFPEISLYTERVSSYLHLISLNQPNIKETTKKLAFFAEATEELTSLVRNKFGDMEAANKLLTRANTAKPNPVTKYLLSNPTATIINCTFLWAAGLALAISGAAACLAPGGVILGLPMIAAGIALFCLGQTIQKICKIKPLAAGEEISGQKYQGLKSEVGAHRALNFGLAGDHLSNVIKHVKTITTIKTADRLLNEANYRRLGLDRPS